MPTLSSLECSCPYRVKDGHITAGWVGECCSELDTPIAIPKSELKNIFVGIFQDAARYILGKRSGNGMGWGW